MFAKLDLLAVSRPRNYGWLYKPRQYCRRSGQKAAGVALHGFLGQRSKVKNIGSIMSRSQVASA